MRLAWEERRYWRIGDRLWTLLNWRERTSQSTVGPTGAGLGESQSRNGRLSTASRRGCAEARRMSTPANPLVRRGPRGRKRRGQQLQREAKEENFLLRVNDRELAERIREALRHPEGSQEFDVSLEFEGSQRKGQLVVNGQHYPVQVQDLPTVVESYKTLDDVHCVKITDIGQILLVGNIPASRSNRIESLDGVTPPFRNAREEVLKPPLNISTGELAQVEEALLAILDGCAPPGCKFIDVVEECVEVDGQLKWVESGAHSSKSQALDGDPGTSLV